MWHTMAARRTLQLISGTNYPPTQLCITISLVIVQTGSLISILLSSKFCKGNWWSVKKMLWGKPKHIHSSFCVTEFSYSAIGGQKVLYRFACVCVWGTGYHQRANCHHNSSYSLVKVRALLHWFVHSANKSDKSLYLRCNVKDNSKYKKEQSCSMYVNSNRFSRACSVEHQPTGFWGRRASQNGPKDCGV